MSDEWTYLHPTQVAQEFRQRHLEIERLGMQLHSTLVSARERIATLEAQVAALTAERDEALKRIDELEADLAIAQAALANRVG